VLPGWLAALDGSIRPGLIVQSINGLPISELSDICKILNGPRSKWLTISTRKTFSAFKTSQELSFD